MDNQVVSGSTQTPSPRVEVQPSPLGLTIPGPNLPVSNSLDDQYDYLTPNGEAMTTVPQTRSSQQETRPITPEVLFSGPSQDF